MRIFFRERLSNQIRGILASGMEAALDIHGEIQNVINSMECYANMIVAMSRVRQHQHYASIMRYVALCCKSILYLQNIRTLVKAAGRDMAGHAPPMDNVAIVVQRDCVAKRATRGMVVTDTWVLMDNMSVSKT